MAAILVIEDDHKLQDLIEKILPGEKLGMIRINSEDPIGSGLKAEVKSKGGPPVSFEEIVREVIKAEVDTGNADNIHESIIGRVERALIGIVLEEEHGNQVRASKKLGINRNTLRKKMKDLHISTRVVMN
jgi:DNA-binding protein Fis